MRPMMPTDECVRPASTSHRQLVERSGSAARDVGPASRAARGRARLRGAVPERRDGELLRHTHTRSYTCELPLQDMQDPGGLVCFPRTVPWQALCVCVRTCVLPYCSSCLWCIWNSNHTLGAHACLFVSLCLLFANVGQVSAKVIASLIWTLFTSLLPHGFLLL